MFKMIKHTLNCSLSLSIYCFFPSFTGLGSWWPMLEIFVLCNKFNPATSSLTQLDPMIFSACSLDIFLHFLRLSYSTDVFMFVCSYYLNVNLSSLSLLSCLFPRDHTFPLSQMSSLRVGASTKWSEWGKVCSNAIENVVATPSHKLTVGNDFQPLGTFCTGNKEFNFVQEYAKCRQFWQPVPILLNPCLSGQPWQQSITTPICFAGYHSSTCLPTLYL